MSQCQALVILIALYATSINHLKASPSLPLYDSDESDSIEFPDVPDVIDLPTSSELANSIAASSNDSNLVPTPRIVGGTAASDGQFPFQVSLRQRGSHVCGGAILTRNYVVTAAHCVVQGNNPLPARNFDVLVGTTRLSGGGGGTSVRIAEIKIHPNYQNSRIGNDIALLRLSSELPAFGARIAAIALATSDPPANARVTISGWGRIRANGPSSNQLLFTRSQFITNTDCRRRIGNVPETVLCLLHGRGNGVCHGDSGGPAIYNGQLIGITNFIIGSCARSAPDGFARVSILRNWLVTNSDL